MVQLTFGRNFPSENEGFLHLKMLCQKECGYTVEELNFLANTICMLPRKMYSIVQLNFKFISFYTTFFVWYYVVVNKPVVIVCTVFSNMLCRIIWYFLWGLIIIVGYLPQLFLGCKLNISLRAYINGEPNIIRHFFVNENWGGGGLCWRGLIFMGGGYYRNITVFH